MDTSDPLKLLNESSNKSWCPVPWNSCSTTTSGQYRLCCQATTDKKTRGLFLNDDGSPLMAETSTIAESRNSRLNNEVRTSMLNGEQHSACVRCKKEEDAGVISRRALARHNELRDKSIDLEKCQSLTKKDGSIDPSDFGIKELDLRLGNKCNLKCRSCNPSESSGWYKEWYETVSTKFNSGNNKVILRKNEKGQVISINDTNDWAQDSALFTSLHKDAPEFELISLVGGEPFLIEEHFSALEDLVEKERAQNITLSYNTNITVLPERALNLWKYFKEVKIGYSIDGVGAVNDYIRFPAKWDVINENLKKLDQAPGHFDIWPTVTVMAYNILYIPEIIKWQLESQFKRQNRHPFNLLLVQHSLKHPVELSAAVLPKNVKLHVENTYAEFKNKWFSDYVLNNIEPDQQNLWTQRLEQIFSSIIHEMNSQDLSPLLPQFLKRTESMDQYRNQNFSKTLPELFDLLQ